MCLCLSEPPPPPPPPPIPTPQTSQLKENLDVARRSNALLCTPLKTAVVGSTYSYSRQGWRLFQFSRVNACTYSSVPVSPSTVCTAGTKVVAHVKDPGHVCPPFRTGKDLSAGGMKTIIDLTNVAWALVIGTVMMAAPEGKKKG